jgi:hypothetical protein
MNPENKTIKQDNNAYLFVLLILLLLSSNGYWINRTINLYNSPPEITSAEAEAVLAPSGILFIDFKVGVNRLINCSYTFAVYLDESYMNYTSSITPLEDWEKIPVEIDDVKNNNWKYFRIEP